MQATRHFPEIALIAAMVSSTDLAYEGHRIASMEPAGSMEVYLVTNEGAKLLRSKLMLQSSQFSAWRE